MQRTLLQQVILLLGCVGLLTALVGCAARTSERYVPPPEASGRALEAALQAWQQGRPTGKLTEGPPTVCVVDSHRREGQVLSRYKVLGETPGNGPRCFAVRLFLDNPQEVVKVRYVLVGIDPLWVIRHEDFEMISHWECNDPAPAGSPGSPVLSPKP